MLNFTTFANRIGEVSGFEGFSPRMTLLGKLRNADHTRNTSCVLMIIVIFHYSFSRIQNEKEILAWQDISHKLFLILVKR